MQKNVSTYSIMKRVAAALVLIAIPAISILGTTLMNVYNENALQLALILLISCVPIAVASSDWVPQKFYSLAIFSISLGLVLHDALISQHLWGSDIQVEYYYYTQVVTTGHWNVIAMPVKSGLAGLAGFAFLGYAASLSVTVFPAMYSTVSSVNGIQVFKIVFPILYSIVPLILYLIFRRRLPPRLAFLAAFMFAAVPSFYVVDLTSGKLMISVVILSIFVLLLTDSINCRSKNLCLFLLGVGITLVYYSVGLYFVTLLVVISLGSSLAGKKSSLSAFLVASMSALYFNWWDVNAHGEITSYFINGFRQTYLGLNSFLDLNSRYAIDLISNYAVGLVAQAVKAVNIAFQAMIAIGIIDYLIRRRRNESVEFTWEFGLMSILNFAFLASLLVLPFLSVFFDINRSYGLTLLFLAPFGILGGKTVVRAAISHKYLDRVPWLAIFGTFCAVFLLFNAGFVSAVTSEPYPSAFALIPNSPYPVYSDREYAGGFWLVTHAQPHALVYSDANAYYLFIGMSNINLLDMPYPQPNATTLTQAGNIVFLRPWNLMTGKIVLTTPFAKGTITVPGQFGLRQQLGTFIENSDKVYDNGYAQSFLYP